MSDTRGASFLAALAQRFEELGLDEHELAVEAGALLDLIEELAGTVEAEGTIIRDARGTRIHPAQVELRHAREQLRKTLAALKLPEPA